MNNRDEVVGRIIEWLNVEALDYTLKENDSDRFWATIQLSENLNLDIIDSKGGNDLNFGDTVFGDGSGDDVINNGEGGDLNRGDTCNYVCVL